MSAALPTVPPGAIVDLGKAILALAHEAAARAGLDDAAALDALAVALAAGALARGAGGGEALTLEHYCGFAHRAGAAMLAARLADPAQSLATRPVAGRC